MINVLRKIAGTTFAISMFLLSAGQGESRFQAFVIHEDPVKPHMTEEYENAAHHLNKLSSQHKLDASWLTVHLDDNRFLYVTPIKNMAELDKNIFEPLQKNMSKEDFGKIWSGFDKSYENHHDYILRLDKELSYMPAGMTINPTGMPYRHFTYYYVAPENVEKVEMIGRKFKELYANKGVQQHYRIYRNGFGEPRIYYLVVSAAKDEEDHARMNAARKQKLGDEGKALYEKLMKHVTGVEHVTGWVRNDMSYNMK